MFFTTHRSIQHHQWAREGLMRLVWAVNCFYHVSSFLLCRQKRNKQKKCRTFNLQKRRLPCRRSSDRCGWPWEGAFGCVCEIPGAAGIPCCDILREPRMAGPGGSWCVGGFVSDTPRAARAKETPAAGKSVLLEEMRVVGEIWHGWTLSSSPTGVGVFIWR